MIKLLELLAWSCDLTLYSDHQEVNRSRWTMTERHVIYGSDIDLLFATAVLIGAAMLCSCLQRGST